MKKIEPIPVKVGLYIEKIEFKIERLELENKKLQQEKKELLNALRKVNEIRDQLLQEKKELRENILGWIEIYNCGIYADCWKIQGEKTKQLLSKIKE